VDEGHSNMVRAQETWDAIGRGELAGLDDFRSDLVETGTAPDGDAFDNMAIWISRLDPDGKTERIWTIDLDQEHCEGFWDRHIGERPGG